MARLVGAEAFTFAALAFLAGAAGCVATTSPGTERTARCAEPVVEYAVQLCAVELLGEEPGRSAVLARILDSMCDAHTEPVIHLARPRSRDQVIEATGLNKGPALDADWRASCRLVARATGGTLQPSEFGGFELLLPR